MPVSTRISVRETRERVQAHYRAPPNVTQGIVRLHQQRWALFSSTTPVSWPRWVVSNSCYQSITVLNVTWLVQQCKQLNRPTRAIQQQQRRQQSVTRCFAH